MILRIRDNEGNVQEVLTLRGEKGDTGATGPRGPQGEAGAAGSDASVTKANVITALGYTPIDPASISLGIASDGLIYIFADGTPVGTGIPQGQSGDVFGYVDENNTIVLNGNLADGTYSVKYEMENGNVVNIGDMVLDSNVYHSVTSTLTNCTINNSAKQIVEGGSYAATVTAKDGCELKSVTVTMGGSPVSVSGGSISIASVTGDIIITAVAEEIVAEVRTNFCIVDTSVTTAPNPSNPAVGYANTNPSSPSYGWISGGRCSSSGADRTDSATTCITNYIPVQNGDIVYVKNLDISTTVYSGIYKSDYTAISGFMMTSSASAYVKDIDLSGEWEQFTINNANAGFIRICGAPSIYKDANGKGFFGKYDVTKLDIVINIKRNGTWL